MSRIKSIVANLFERTGLNDGLLRVLPSICGPMIRAVNYHDVPPRLSDAFENQLRFYRDRFDGATVDALLAIQAGRLKPRRPLLILSFDDGLRSHAEVVAPLLEKYGFSGWFFVPAGLVASDRNESDRLARETRTPPYLTWSELARLAQRHIVGSHTMTHKRLRAELTDAERYEEIVESKRLLESRLDRQVPIFCWVGGEEWTYSAEAARVIRQAGYRISFMTNNLPIRSGNDLMQLQRTNIEADFPLELLKFQMSGVLDVMYTPKRRRVNRVTRA